MIVDVGDRVGSEFTLACDGARVVEEVVHRAQRGDYKRSLALRLKYLVRGGRCDIGGVDGPSHFSTTAQAVLATGHVFRARAAQPVGPSLRRQPLRTLGRFCLTGNLKLVEKRQHYRKHACVILFFSPCVLFFFESAASTERCC